MLGLAFFTAMTALNPPRLWRTPGRRPRLVRLAAASIGVVMVLYLLSVELFVLDAICLWCTAVHTLTVALFAVAPAGDRGTGASMAVLAHSASPRRSVRR